MDDDLIDYFDSAGEDSECSAVPIAGPVTNGDLRHSADKEVDKTASMVGGEEHELDLDEVFHSESAVDNGDSHSYVPAVSTVHTLSGKQSLQTEGQANSSSQSSTIRQQQQLYRPLIDPKIQHECLLGNEFRHLSMCMQVNSKYELLRVQEECYRYHYQGQREEERESSALSVFVLAEIDEELNVVMQEKMNKHNNAAASAAASKRLSTSTFNSLFNSSRSIFDADTTQVSATRRFVDLYSTEYQNLRQHAHAHPNLHTNLYFPWHRFDADVLRACAHMLQTDELASCEIYLCGFIESVSRVPDECLSIQGKQCIAVAGVALGRHPFGSAFTKYILAMKTVANRAISIIHNSSGNMNKLSLATILSSIINNKVNEFVGLMAHCWANNWTTHIPKNKNDEFLAMLKRSLHSVVTVCLPEVDDIHAIIDSTSELVSLERFGDSTDSHSTLKKSFLLSTISNSASGSGKREGAQEFDFDAFKRELSELLGLIEPISSSSSSSSSSSPSSSSLTQYLRERAFDGQLCNRYLRGMCWRLMLNLLPDVTIGGVDELDGATVVDTAATWKQALALQVQQYKQLKDFYMPPRANEKNGDSPKMENDEDNDNDGELCNRQHVSNISPTISPPMSPCRSPPPIDPNEVNPMFQDKGLTHEINIDLNRLYIEGIDAVYTQNRHIHAKLFNVLYVWSSVYKESLSYRQGMHEIAAIICFVIDEEQLAWGQLAPEHELHDLFRCGDEYDSSLNADIVIEAFIYHIFHTIMAELQATYLPDIVQFCDSIQGPCLQELDPVLSMKLNGHTASNSNDSPAGRPRRDSNAVQPQLYGLRWCRLMFCREFTMIDTQGFRLWDFILAYYREPSTTLESELEDTAEGTSGCLDFDRKETKQRLIVALADVTLAMIIRVGQVLDCIP
jgi:hypothetical protein